MKLELPSAALTVHYIAETNSMLLTYTLIRINTLVLISDDLENIQRRFTKRVPSLSHLSYFPRLSALELEPLVLRRLKFDLILTISLILHEIVWQ